MTERVACGVGVVGVGRGEGGGREGRWGEGGELWAVEIGRARGEREGRQGERGRRERGKTGGEGAERERERERHRERENTLKKDREKRVRKCVQCTVRVQRNVEESLVLQSLLANVMKPSNH